MTSSWWLIPTALLGSLVIRLVISTMYALRSLVRDPGTPTQRFAREWSKRFRGRYDFWHPYVLGAIEIVVFSVLMATNEREAVGAWLGLKTVVQWQHWQEERSVFTIYLIGTALVVIVSYCAALCPWLFPTQNGSGLSLLSAL
jgi:hypothetical protein